VALLELKDVCVRYPIYNAGSMSLRQRLVQVGTGGRIGGGHHKLVTVQALDNVSITLRDGDAAAIVGHNGAGKSTLLRTMAGIYMPDSGRVIAQGQIGTVFELGAGMDPELSGYENILRVLMLNGQSLEQARAATPTVEEFSELGDFLSLPVRTYSSGMTMRLMFATATAVQPSILLLDEMFSTGDAEFQERAKDKLHQWIATSEIVVFASHDHGLLKKLCNRFFRLSHGDLVEIDASDLGDSSRSSQ
jgi:ABC-type polysaccharide/polyol phosphate transport system ATPase subunit